MIKHVKISLLAMFCTLIGAAVLWSASAQEMTAEKAFKNIQVLKGIPAGQMTALMDNFNKALGVDCAYCHTMNALEKDDKPAHKMSRQMIKMTRDIQQNYKIKIDCMACHQGKAKPPHLGQNMGFGPSGLGSGGGKDVSQTTTAAPTKENPNPKPPPPPPANAADPPGKMTFKASFGPVPFDHGTHMNLGDCATCHHTGETNKCTSCHQRSGVAAKMIWKQTAHNATSERGCIGCHTKQKAGPTKCAECHKK